MTGRGPKNRDIDQSLFEWYSQRRAAGERPRSCEVRAKKALYFTKYGHFFLKIKYFFFSF